MEFSDSRMKDISKIIKTPADGGAAEYRQRLYAETKKDKSLMAYLHWSVKNRIKPEMPKISPQDTLGKLSVTDYGDVASVMKLRTDLSFSVISDLELAKDKGDQFVVVADPEAVISTEKAPNEAPGDQAQPSFHPGLLKTRTAQPKDGDLPFPAIVLPVGRLLWKDIRPIGEFGDTRMQKDPKLRSFEETNYVIVMDAVNPQHPVWLVFNRNMIDESDRLVTIDPLASRVVFRRIGRNFDAAQLFPSAREWLSQYNQGRLETLTDSIQSTMRMGGVIFETATMKEVSDAFRGPRPPPGG